MTWKHAKVFARRYGGAFIVLAALGGIIFTGHAPVTTFVASTGSLGGIRGATLFIAPREESLAPGQTGMLDVRVTAEVPINAIGATIRFDPTALEVVGISKEHSFFDLWTEETVIREEVGAIRFSGGTVRPGGLQGTGTILTLSVRAKHEGETTVFFEETTVYAHDGRGSAVGHGQQSLALIVRNADTGESIVLLNGDFNGDGRITVTDLTMLTIQLFAPYNARYDLDQNGVVDLADFSALYLALRR